MSDGEVRKGGCLCGAVRYEAEVGGRYSVCYCKMCQRWSSGVFMGVPTTAFRVTDGEGCLNIAKTSEWASRAFCGECGSNIYYHAAEYGHPSVALGSLDNTDGLEPRIQFFVDKKPEGFAVDRETKCMTEADVMAMFFGKGESQ